MFVTLKVFKLIGPSIDGRRHGRGTYLLFPVSVRFSSVSRLTNPIFQNKVFLTFDQWRTTAWSFLVPPAILSLFRQRLGRFYSGQTRRHTGRICPLYSLIQFREYSLKKQRVLPRLTAKPLPVFHTHKYLLACEAELLKFELNLFGLMKFRRLMRGLTTGCFEAFRHTPCATY
jgi:hypothetical protein